jgi:hypothetical protein
LSEVPHELQYSLYNDPVNPAYFYIFKDYIKGGPAILAVDAGMIAGSIVLAAFLKQYDYHYTGSLTLVTLYTLTYILYTNVNFKKAQ